MNIVDTAFVLLALLLATALVALRAKTPPPVVYALGGIAAGLALCAGAARGDSGA